ncbi:MAG: hypothetical protein IPO17_17815 [Flavobacteriales bacterium]|nr:hypothetical protein [Flavobacteriales bacterium]
MKTSTLLLWSCLAVACGTSEPADNTPSELSKPSAGDLQWTRIAGLQGRWVNDLDTGRTLTYEEWTRRDSVYWSGWGYVLAGADTVSIEELRIVRKGDLVAYGAKLSTQNGGDWVDFTQEQTGADTLLFSNTAHDFPQRIQYVKQGSAWHASVSNATEGFELHFMPRTDAMNAAR